MLEPRNLPGQTLNGALLHVQIKPSVDGQSAQRLLEEADDGCRAA
jgi:hypothetical protein